MRNKVTDVLLAALAACVVPAAASTVRDAVAHVGYMQIADDGTLQVREEL